MRNLLLVVIFAALACAPSDPDLQRWEERAQHVTITRDDWGIPHVSGRTDADAVFGLVYAQAEDDFPRVELNYINALGRLAEAEGEAEVFRDLRMKLFVDPEDLERQYAASPPWLRALMDAFADGLNYYLYTHPAVRPRVITRFEPWMALAFTEGSIGGDIERISVARLAAFYGDRDAARPLALGPPTDGEPRGSNGIAIAPQNTVDRHALLLINPHTSFFFRAEVHMTSEEGLDAYGAVTWGQFFIYQGFNERAGWMHTSSGVDNIDEYLEVVVERHDSLFYRHGDALRPVALRRVVVPFRTDSGMAQRTFTVYRTHHGPVVRDQDGAWVSVALMQDPVDALTQSYTRTKARSYDEFLQTMQLHTNSSNNTVYADADGTIAYFHSNFIPQRDPRFDWTRPVDGSDPATDWQGVLSLEETPGVRNPSVGWIQNTNNWPWSVSGRDSPRQEDFPAYVEAGGENPRGVHAVRLLEHRRDFTLQSLLDAAFDSYLPAFELLLPPLFAAWDRLPAADPLRQRLAEPIDSLRSWDRRWSSASVPTSLAVFWGEGLFQQAAREGRAGRTWPYDAEGATTPSERLQALADAVATLEEDFGTWRTAWGEINRFQRLTGDIVQPFSDSAPSIPVMFTSARWGSLASFGARAYPGTKRWYGTSGNSFVAVVEFGDSVRARAVTAGGLSNDPASPHFNDQTLRYATGDLREVYFYPSQLEAHVERRYRPGEGRQ